KADDERANFKPTNSSTGESDLSGVLVFECCPRAARPSGIQMRALASCRWIPGSRFLRHLLRLEFRIVIEDGREPALGLRDAPALAAGVILHLIALDLADAEIVTLRMAEIKAAHRRARPHGEALGEL